MLEQPFIVVHIIPTGIGASIGGYAGDATAVTNLIASVSDYVITHPNVVNAANLYYAYNNVLYVEGYSLDQFLLGKIGLEITRSNTIGIIIDKGCKKFISDIVNAINASKITASIDIKEYIFTKEPVNSEIIYFKEAGIYGGKIHNPKVLLEAAKHLINQNVNALAVFTYIKDIPSDADKKYQEGKGPDPIGIIEALISRTISYKFNIPVAHAPLFDLDTKRKIVYNRVAAEEIGYTFIPCVLKGLSKAPKIINRENVSKWTILNTNIAAIITPYNALGGIGILANLCCPIIAVKENRTILNIDKEVLKLPNVIEVSNYYEATGLLVSLKQGLKIYG